MESKTGLVLIVLGLWFVTYASFTARSASNLHYLMGTFMPGVLCLTIGWVLLRERKPQAKGPPPIPLEGQSPGTAQATPIAQIKRRAGEGIVSGIAIMFIGNGFAQAAPQFLFLSGAVALGGWGLLIWGCVNYARWKGYSGWSGLFGYLLLPGLLILLCLPNRRKRVNQVQAPSRAAQLGLPNDEQCPGYRFLLALMPLAVLLVVLEGFFFRAQLSVANAEWKQVAPEGLGFQIQMPGSPRVENRVHETMTDKVEVHKFTVLPKGKKEMFLVVSQRMPRAAIHKIGGPNELLEIGRRDVLAAAKGKVDNEAPTNLKGWPGLELIVFPSSRGVIKARVYATDSQIYEVMCYTSKARLTSKDIAKFFDSFTLLTESAAAQ